MKNLERLDARLRELGRLAVAVSGGVDTGAMLHAAVRVLGADAVGVIADSASLPRRDLAEARELARAIGARLVELTTEELADERYRKNDGLRCYHCRRILFESMGAWARREGFVALAYGEIADDALDERPGRRAASEHHVVAPLAEAGWTKVDVRAYARQHGLAVAERPASACLASRIPPGTAVTREALQRIERAEEAVRALGLRVLRVRDRGALARLEVGRDELEQATRRLPELEHALLEAGFTELELDVYVPPGAR
ncbi:MAG: ATP-dependent sacrificial sulfur transferase LarE [Planctomycetota bacterium]